MKKEYICPKCESNNWKVSENRGFDTNPDNRTCGDCGYRGTFLIKEKIRKTK